MIEMELDLPKSAAEVILVEAGSIPAGGLAK